ncbi:aminotransferase yhxA [Cytobacillus praedii]|uniref:aminotransferase yhxA n=1 Tax=Cytobacillus praedii TaxID=1742358 RepID=UPI002E2258F7|nr:aminotransferase yhxA [Cytobacillus praedii]
MNTLGKTRKVMAGITTALTLGLVGCSSQSADVPSPPNDPNCDDWEWDTDDGIWACEDSSSRHYGHYYYGGYYYGSKSALLKSDSYKNYKNSTSFKGGGKTSSGFGSGSKSIGG